MAAHDEVAVEVGVGAQELDQLDGVGTFGDVAARLDGQAVVAGQWFDGLAATGREARHDASDGSVGEAFGDQIGLAATPEVEGSLEVVETVAAAPGRGVTHEVQGHEPTP